MRRARVLFLTVLAATLVGVGGCTSHSTAPTTIPPVERLAMAKKVLDGAQFVTLSLTSKNVPPGVNGVTAATGIGEISSTEPRFKGSITGTVQGIAGTVDLISIGATAYMKFFTPDYVKTNLADLNAPNPSVFFNPDKGVSTLLTEVQDPKSADPIRSGDEVLDRFTGTLPGAQIQSLFMLGDGTGSYSVTFGITAKNELRTATMTGPFFAGATSTFTLRLTGYGTPADITKP